MKNKILKTLLVGLITLNIWGFLYHEHEVKVYKDQISHLQDNVKTKSTKIAKLGDTIDLQNETIVKQKRVIDIKTNEISVLEKQNHAKTIEIHTLKNHSRTNTNFNKGSKGDGVGRSFTVEASAYVSMCSEGCTGKTTTGVDVSNTIYYKGFHVIAVDTKLIPLNSLVKVDTRSGTFKALAIDTGGYIRGNRIDILVGSKSEALNFGRQEVKVTILKEG